MGSSFQLIDEFYAINNSIRCTFKLLILLLSIYLHNCTFVCVLILYLMTVKCCVTFQELGGTSTAMERERVTVKELMAEVKNMMWNTEIAIRSYMMLRPRFLHQSASTISNGVSTSQTFGATMNSSMSNQPTSNSVASVYDFYYGLPKRPSPFMQHTVSRFEKCLIECYQWIEELEQLVLMDTDKTSSSSGLVLLQSLPNVMSNVHDFFVHVAAKVSAP